MNSLITIFKKDIHAALQNYARQLRRQHKKMPSHRQKDIAEIQKILETPAEDMTQKIQAITRQTQQFYTGFLFWRTGNSQLKNQLNHALKPYLNSQLLEIQAQVFRAPRQS